MEDAEKESSIDPKTALITLAAGVAVRYYLMDVIKLLVILAILLGDASFVTVLYVRYLLLANVSFIDCCFVHFCDCWTSTAAGTLCQCALCQVPTLNTGHSIFQLFEQQ